MSGWRLVKASAECPHCDVKKHQIDSTKERAFRIVADALDAHIREAHPNGGAPA